MDGMGLLERTGAKTGRVGCSMMGFIDYESSGNEGDTRERERECARDSMISISYITEYSPTLGIGPTWGVGED